MAGTQHPAFSQASKTLQAMREEKKYMALVLSGNMWHKLRHRRLNLALPYFPPPLLSLSYSLLALSGLVGPQQTTE